MVETFPWDRIIEEVVDGDDVIELGYATKFEDANSVTRLDSGLSLSDSY